MQATDNPALPEGVISALKPTSYLSRTYRSQGLEADLFISFYAQQRAGESMHSPKHCLPGSGWEIWKFGSERVAAAGSLYTVNRYHISRDGQRMAVVYWYQSARRVVASEYEGKLLLAGDALLHRGTAGSIVRLVVPDRPEDVQQALRFAAELIPQVRRCFGE
jgi:EpsI family protein